MIWHDRDIPCRAFFFTLTAMEKINNLYLYELPLSNNDGLTAIVGRDGRPVFDYVDTNVDERFAASLTAKLNGSSRHTFPELFEAQDESIAFGGRRILDIRGWGWLTDVCGFSGRDAQEEQQWFIEWCVERLNADKEA